MNRNKLGVRKNLKEHQRREAIIQAAIQLFSTKGYDGTTMSDLASMTGTSKTLIYWYWDNKAALFSELIDLCMMPYCELLEKAIESPDPYLDKLYRFFMDFAGLFRKNEALNKLVHFGSLHMRPANVHENFSEQVNAYYKRVQALLHGLICQGIKMGIFKEDLDTSAISFFLLLSVEGYIYMSMLEDRMPLERALLDHVQNIMLPGVMFKNDI